MEERGSEDGPFDQDVIDAVATEYDVPTAYLEEVIARHQSRIRESPGADNLVYEWRRNVDGRVLDRTDRAFYVSVPATVWTEFADDLSLEPPTGVALRAVHRRQVRTHADAEGPADDRTYVVVERR